MSIQTLFLSGALMLGDCKLMDLMDVQSGAMTKVGEVKEATIDTCPSRTWMPSASVEFTMEDCAVNESVFEKLLKPTESQKYGMTLDFGAKYKQKRQHRSKRINKKWAKRYGFEKRSYTATTSDVEVLRGTKGYDFSLSNCDLIYKTEDVTYDEWLREKKRQSHN